MAINERARRTGRWFKDVFFPHEGNDHRPHLLRPRTVAFVCIVAVVAELGFFIAATYFVPRTKFFGIIDANALVDETNQQRTGNGVSALTVSPLLTQAAQDKANDMAANGYFAHTSPSGITPWYWFEKVGYVFSAAGENLAVNFTDSQAVTDAWMNSPEHRANILDGQFTQIGIATAQGTYNGQPAVYVAEEFGTPAAAPIAFVNAASAAESAPTTVTSTVPTETSGGTFTVTIPANETLGGTVAAQSAGTRTGTKPVTKASPKPVAAVTAVVATSAVASSNAQPIAITIPAAMTTTVPQANADAIQPAAQVNALQRLVSNPAALANDFYYALMALFAAAVILNMFSKVRLRYPHLIAGGMAVIVVAGLLVLFNQSIGIFHAVIL